MSTTGLPEISPCGNAPSPALLLEAQFCNRLRQFALRSRGTAWFRQAEADLQLKLDDQELFENWYGQLVYYHYGQPTVFESFLAERPALSTQEKTLVWALRQVRLSIFAIIEVRRGHSILMEDLLFGERAWVLESTLAEPDMLKAVLLARLAQVGNEILLMGMYIRPMADWKARQIAMEIRSSELTPESVGQPALAARLTRRFRQGLQELDECTMPLQITPEGEPLCQVRDRFAFAPSAATLVRRALDDFPELYWESPKSARWLIGTSELGRLVLQKNALILECKSLGRADRLGESLRRIPAFAVPRRTQQAPPSASSIRQSYEEWARRWPDQAVAALGGLSPRQAVASSAGRSQVSGLLKDFEFYLATLPSEQSISLRGIRRELGLISE
ncbi:MAG: hypothetical protein KF760_03630 [Candidatus Eremiobacteraeota bacterium]|nr:hypothetical protein [Candidatus Eremiobacteraeota bacterium]MCW5871792.1 hypothetical protein [Candidatus Eremiobacteraeota bacterium]